MMISSSDVASSSSTPLPLTSKSPQKYDVFISFRGSDTRQTFTSHLYKAIDERGISTFIDDELRRGDPISTLFPIIENSKISVVILSPNYASSKWCLNELVKILNRKETDEQIVIPVFYNVDPSEVKKQTGNYAKAFTEEHDGKQSPETIQKWRNALREVSELSGWNNAVTRPDSLLTEKIAKDILNKLIAVSPSYNKEGLVGIDSKIEAIESMLSLGSANSFAVGIWGIGGIGKTTLAKAVIDKIFTEFEDAYFINNISKNEVEYKVWQRNYIFSPVSNFTLERLWRKKVIIVFDNVSSLVEADSIIGLLKLWENNGSRFIMTSRDRQLLDYLCRRNIYKLNGLFDDEAYQLFTQHACKGEFHITEHKDCLSKKVVQYARGVPLALKVLGSYLCNRDSQQWESAIKKLEKIPHHEVQSVLKISYDGLENSQKKIFLDIACFFCGESRDFLKAYFDACGFEAEIELAILEERCLIERDMPYLNSHEITMNRCFIESDMRYSNYDKMTMHDMIQRMGRDIVRQESNDDPGKRSRLWHHEDICQIFIENTGTKAIECISLDMSKITDINLKKDAFNKMKKLRLLNLYSSEHIEAINKVHVPHDFHFVLNELRYFRWDGFPLRSLESGFNPRYLVKLDITASNIEQLWVGVQPLSNLRTVSLRTCYKLTTIPDLSKAQNLQDLYIDFCPSFKSLPSLKFLTKLFILNCPKLEVIPELPSNLEKLDLCRTTIAELPSAIGHLSRLKELRIEDCSKFNSLPQNIGDLDSLRKLDALHTSIEELPSSICKLKFLYKLRVSYNAKLARFPQNIGNLESLQELDVSHTAIEELPSSICRLKSLWRLQVSYNKKLARLPLNIGDIESLEELDAFHTAIEELPSSICKLKSLRRLRVSYNKKLATLPQNIGDIESLEELDACHTAIEELPSSICKLKSLGRLQVSYNEKLARLPQNIGDIEFLEELIASNTAIEELPSSICKLKSLGLLQVFCNEKLARLPQNIGDLESLPELNASHIAIEELPSSICKLKSLYQLQVSGNTRLARLPQNIGDIESLQELDASNTAVEELPSSICKLKSLRRLQVSYNKKLARFPQNIEDLESLEELNASHTAIEELSSSICRLKSLYQLQVSYNKKLARLPQNIGDIESLEELDASHTAIEELPSSICRLKSLYQLQVSYNKKLARLPQNIGDIKSLEELDASHTAIEELPSSICRLKSLYQLQVSYNKKLARLPQNIGDIESLEELDASHTAIEELPSSICKLKSLCRLQVSYNEKLARLPQNIGDIESLQELDASHTTIEELPLSICKLKFLFHLHVSYNKKLARFPQNIGDLKSLQKLNASHIAIEELPSSICKLKSLYQLQVSYNTKLARLPQNIGDLESLEELDASHTAIEELPSSICRLKSRCRLQVSYNKKLARLPQNIGDIESLQELDASHTAIEELPSSICKLKSLRRLQVSYNEKLARLPQNIGDIESLEELDASHTAIEELPSSICKLKSLHRLRVSYNKKLARLPQNIGDLKSLQELDASHTTIEDLPSSVCYLLALVKLILCGAKLKCFPTSILYLKSLEYLGLCGIEELETLPHDLANFGDSKTSNFLEIAKAIICVNFHLSFQCCYERHAIFHEDLGNLKPVMEESPIWLYDAKLKCFPRNKLKSLVELSRWSTLPNSFGHLFDCLRDSEAFEILDASGTSIKERPLPLSYQRRREYLGLSNRGILKLPDNFGQLNFLKRLNLSSNEFENLPASVIDLSQLESLNLSSCHRLQALPELPRNLYFLDASNCSSLKTLPSSSILFATFKTCYPKCTFLLGCYKLDKDSIKAITEYALLKPQLKVMASQHDDLLKFQGYCMKNDAYVIYPGSKIPEWFSSQSIGSLITLELPLQCYNRMIVGIAVCAVVHLPCSKIDFYYKFDDNDGQSNGRVFELFQRDYGYSTPKSLSAYHGYHVCIAYLPCSGSMSQLKSMTVSFGFCVWRMTSSEEPPMICFDVEACGVRFLYGQNLRKRNRDSSSIDEELGSPNKRVKGCTNEDYTESFSIVVDSLSSLEIL